MKQNWALAAGNSTEVLSAEVPDASAAVVEPVESKQTVSLQTAEKPLVKSDDDNSNLMASAVDSTNTAIKDASDSISDTARMLWKFKRSSLINWVISENAKETLSSAADSISRQASDVRQSAEQGVSGITENSATSSYIASSLVLAVAFFNSIHHL